MVGTQLHTFTQINTYNYMFRPCILAIVRLYYKLNPSNAELNPICHLLALLGAHHILHVNRIRVNK